MMKMKRGGKMAKRYLLLKEKRWAESLDLKSSIWKPDRWGSFRSCSLIRFCRSSSSSKDSLSISKRNAEMPKGPIQFQRMESEFMHIFRKSNRKVKQGGYGNLSYPRPAPFKFLNGMGMRIILNKRGGVRMGATRPEPAPLPSLNTAFLPTWSNLILFCSFQKHPLHRSRLKPNLESWPKPNVGYQVQMDHYQTTAE